MQKKIGSDQSSLDCGVGRISQGVKSPTGNSTVSQLLTVPCSCLGTFCFRFSKLLMASAQFSETEMGLFRSPFRSWGHACPLLMDSE